MITTSPPTPIGNPTWTADQPNAATTGSVLAGLAVAFSLQVLAAVAAIGSIIVVIAAAFANYGSYGAEQESTWWVIFAVPLSIASCATWIMSGFAASRVMRTPLGWLTLLMAPCVMFALIAMS